MSRTTLRLPARAVAVLPVIGILLVLTCLAGCGSDSSNPATTATITARMLVQPNALAGPGPANLTWGPKGAQLAYTLADESGNETLWLYDAASGEKRLLFDPAGKSDDIDVTTVQWSPTGKSMLLLGTTKLWLLDVASGKLSAVASAGSGTLDAMMFTPTGTHVTYALDNDLYVADLSGGKPRRLTTGGGQAIFNGCLDWVYNEELATRGAQPGYAWSPDGYWLMYMRLDDRKVHNDPITDYDTVPATVTYTRYPTAGTTNPAVSLHCIDWAGGVMGSGTGDAEQKVSLPEDTEYMLPFYTWAPDSSEAFFITVNRAHTTLKLNAYDPWHDNARVVIKETDPDWINEDFYAAPIMLPDGKHFLWLSERSGFMQLYLYSLKGDLVRQLTDGDWLIDTTPYGILTAGRPVYVDPSGTWAYFDTTAQSPLERQLCRVNIQTGELQQLSKEPGFHEPALSADGKYLVDQFTAVDTPPVTRILDAESNQVAELGRCAGPSLDLPKVSREFLTIKAHDGTELYAQIVKPEDFDPGRKYPVVIHWYGGPGLQLVSNRYGTTNLFNHIERDTLYTQAGFIVWRLDNRGSFGRGHAFETPIEGQLGPAALDDQLAGIDYLKTLSYVDAERIGTDGKSFGGFLTLYALIHEPDVFRCGVAGSGPTDWAWYDTIYTERYMKTPKENPDGYAATNLVKVAADIKAKPLIIHGLADTNVHLQNSVNFIEALEKADRPFIFVPLPNEDHHYEGDGLATALAASVDYFTEHLTSKE